MSDDPRQKYFSDGIAEDIITDLSHLQTIFPMTDKELLEKFVSDLKAAGLAE